MTVALAGVIMLLPRMGHLNKLSSYNHLKEIKMNLSHHTTPDKTGTSPEHHQIRQPSQSINKYSWKIYN